MKPVLPGCYTWRGNQMFLEAERCDGQFMREPVAIVLNDEAFNAFLRDFANDALANDSTGYRALKLLSTVARMTRYTVDSSDDQLEDAVSTLNRLIQEAKEIVR